MDKENTVKTQGRNCGIIMTNGEKIKEIFPSVQIMECESYIQVMEENYEFNNVYPKKWWNAEYKEPSSSAIPTDSIIDWNNCHTPEQLDSIATTKNDLGVDCVSRADVIRLICEYRDDATETGSERDLERAYGANAVGELISELPSVTPIRPKGHWISHEEHCRNLGVTPSGLGAYEWCSNCDCGIDVREWYRNNYNYCPNCGSYNGGASNGNE